MLNLITDPWIPVRTKSGERRVIAPWQMADTDIARSDWPRADLDLGCYELLIGLVYLADPPEDSEDWEDRRAPDPDRLRSRLAPLASAFELLGDGPRFMQEAGSRARRSPLDLLFIDSAACSTAKNNADLMVRRDRYGQADTALVAMALHTFQQHAPSGGAGNRTSMRGGGPMVTLVDPGRGLWDMIWANVPDGAPQGTDALPWMRPTRVSKTKGSETYPVDGNLAEAFFGMPRRLRLFCASDGSPDGRGPEALGHELHDLGTSPDPLLPPEGRCRAAAPPSPRRPFRLSSVAGDHDPGESNRISRGGPGAWTTGRNAEGTRRPASSSPDGPWTT